MKDTVISKMFAQDTKIESKNTLNDIGNSANNAVESDVFIVLLMMVAILFLLMFVGIGSDTIFIMN